MLLYKNVKSGHQLCLLWVHCCQQLSRPKQSSMASMLLGAVLSHLPAGAKSVHIQNLVPSTLQKAVLSRLPVGGHISPNAGLGVNIAAKDYARSLACRGRALARDSGCLRPSVLPGMRDLLEPRLPPKATFAGGALLPAAPLPSAPESASHS